MFCILNMAINSWNGKIFCIFLIKKCTFTQNFAIQPYIFSFPKFLELFFTPKNTPPKSKNSKLDKIPIFLGTPCRFNWDRIYSRLHWFKMYRTGSGARQFSSIWHWRTHIYQNIRSISSVKKKVSKIYVFTHFLQVLTNNGSVL